jgi:hypothetical protein
MVPTTKEEEEEEKETWYEPMQKFGECYPNRRRCDV